MARPIILGVVGDSATGKTTITKGLVEILGRDNVTHIGMAGKISRQSSKWIEAGFAGRQV